MTPQELAGLKALRASLDALITAAEGAKPKLTPELIALLELEAKADKYIECWRERTGCTVPHNLMLGWIKEHDINVVIGAMNSMFTKRQTTEMDERYQINYVAKVLKANATVPCNAGGITI